MLAYFDRPGTGNGPTEAAGTATDQSARTLETEVHVLLHTRPEWPMVRDHDDWRGTALA